jgi:hypothetical protein
MTPEEMEPAMLKAHPGFKVVPLPDALATFRPMSPDGKPPFLGLRGMFGKPDGQHVADDQIFVYYTMPPTKQQVFALSRSYTYPQPGIERVKLVAALRQKYGKETKSTYLSAAQVDSEIATMYWVFDEQGHLIPTDKGASGLGQPPFNCAPLGTPPGNTWINMVNQFRLNTLPPAGFCDTIVLLSVNVQGFASVRQDCVRSETEIDDFALLRRDAQIAADAAKAQSQKQQQQQLDQSKKAKPSL